jgi:hypothetical protein
VPDIELNVKAKREQPKIPWTLITSLDLLRSLAESGRHIACKRQFLTGGVTYETLNNRNMLKSWFLYKDHFDEKLKEFYVHDTEKGVWCWPCIINKKITGYISFDPKSFDTLDVDKWITGSPLFSIVPGDTHV